MKFTLSWLKSHLQTNAPLDRITNTLTQIKSSKLPDKKRLVFFKQKSANEILDID